MLVLAFSTVSTSSFKTGGSWVRIQLPRKIKRTYRLPGKFFLFEACLSGFYCFFKFYMFIVTD